MKKTLLNLFQKSRYSIVVTCAILPIILALHASLCPAYLWLVWLWPVSFVALDVIGLKIPGKRRLLYCLCEIILQFAIGGLFLWLSGGAFWLVLIPLINVVLLLWGMTLNSEGRKSNLWGAVGIVVHLGAQIYQYTRLVANDPVLDPVSPWFPIIFFLLAGLSILNMNQNGLKNASSGRQSVSRAVQQKNLLLTVVFFGFALLLACIPAVVKGMAWVFQQFLAFLRQLLPKSDATTPGGEPGFNELLRPNIPVKEEQMAPWLNALLTVIAIVVIVAVLGLAVFALRKKIGPFFKKLIALLARGMSNYANAVSDDYVDEVTDLSDDNDMAERRRRNRKLSSIDERRLSPERRIRYRYLRLMYKHPEWARSSTARENIPTPAASLYERVRYSSHSITEENAQQFLLQTKKI